MRNRIALLGLMSACWHSPPPQPPVVAMPVPEHPVGDPATTSDADKPMIKRHIQENLAKLTYCYEKELLAKADLGGVVHATFTIEADGNVSDSTATGITEVNACVAAVIKDIAFERPTSGRAAVAYPFVFRTSDDSTAAAPTVASGGDPDKVMIRRYIRRNLQKIQYCYEKQLLAEPKLAGTTTVAFTIEADGKVSRASGSGMHKDVDACVAAVVKDIVFERPSTGRTEVTYPFVFRAADETKEPAPTIAVGNAPATTGNTDSKTMIRSHIKGELQRITYCYEKQLLAKDGLAGTVTVTFFISPNGTVASSSASGMDPDVATCVADVIKSITFDKPTGGGGIQVNYPFVFHPAS